MPVCGASAQPRCSLLSPIGNFLQPVSSASLYGTMTCTIYTYTVPRITVYERTIDDLLYG